MRRTPEKKKTDKSEASKSTNKLGAKTETRSKPPDPLVRSMNNKKAKSTNKSSTNVEMDEAKAKPKRKYIKKS